MSSLSIDEGLEEIRPALHGKTEEKGAHFVPQAAHGMMFLQRLLKEGTAVLLPLIDQKGQHELLQRLVPYKTIKTIFAVRSDS